MRRSANQQRIKEEMTEDNARREPKTEGPKGTATAPSGEQQPGQPPKLPTASEAEKMPTVTPPPGKGRRGKEDLTEDDAQREAKKTAGTGKKPTIAPPPVADGAEINPEQAPPAPRPNRGRRPVRDHSIEDEGAVTPRRRGHSVPVKIGDEKEMPSAKMPSPIPKKSNTPDAGPLQIMSHTPFGVVSTTTAEEFAFAKGSYFPMRLIRVGRYGVIYQAKRAASPFEENFAMKVACELSELSKFAVNKEIKVYKSLVQSVARSKYVVQFVDEGARLTNGFIMPLMKRTLALYLDNNNTNNIHETRRFMSQMLQGVQYLYGTCKITHNDLNQHTIYVSPNAPLQVKIGSFEMATQFNEKNDYQLFDACSPYYPPEILLKHPRCRKADTYAIAILAIEFITATRFSTKTVSRQLQFIVDMIDAPIPGEYAFLSRGPQLLRRNALGVLEVNTPYEEERNMDSLPSEVQNLAQLPSYGCKPSDPMYVKDDLRELVSTVRNMMIWENRRVSPSKLLQCKFFDMSHLDTDSYWDDEKAAAIAYKNKAMDLLN